MESKSVFNARMSAALRFPDSSESPVAFSTDLNASSTFCLCFSCDSFSSAVSALSDSNICCASSNFAVTSALSDSNSAGVGGLISGTTYLYIIKLKLMKSYTFARVYNPYVTPELTTAMINQSLQSRPGRLGG